MRVSPRGTRGNAHELMRTSLHEAGHAVAAHILGTSMRRMTIVPASASHRPCKEEQPFWATPAIVDHEQKRFVDNYLIVACAGRAAEIVLYGEADDTSAADDMQIVRETLLESPLHLVPAHERNNVEAFHRSFVERHCAAAAELLEPRQRLLYAVARLLLQRGTVEAAEIHALLNRMLVEDA